KKLDYAVSFENDLKKEPDYRCDCGEILEKVELETLDLRSCFCPDCGEKTLYEKDSSFAPLVEECFF
ncbi:MAG: hypothetical protein RR614_07185, partial [Eubacterium sp.]